MKGDVGSRVKDISGDFDSRLDVMRKQADTVRKQASDNWDKLENIFDDRVGRVLSRLGLPTRDDLDRLSKRVQELSRKVAELDQKAGPNKSAVAKPKATGVKKAVVKKALVKKAAPKKAAAKKAAPKKAAAKKAAPKKAAVKKAASRKATPAKAAIGKPATPAVEKKAEPKTATTAN
jgi:hypothetical protein